MPSTHKTGHLSLNNWLGTDKPKKDDFNEDNSRIDNACRRMAQDIGGLAAAGESAGQKLAGLEERCGEVSGTIAAHVAAGVHCTAAERVLWNSGAVTTGTYTGNGGMSQQVAMGFRPRFGVVYAVGKSPVEADWNQDVTDIYFGFFGRSGCSRFIALTDNGITVSHNYTVPVNGCSLLYNESGTVYVYMAWR